MEKFTTQNPILFNDAKDFTEAYLKKYRAKLSIGEDWGSTLIKDLEKMIAEDSGFNIHTWSEEKRKKAREIAIVILTCVQDEGNKNYNGLRSLLSDVNYNNTLKILDETSDLNEGENRGKYPSEGIDYETKKYSYEEIKVISREAQQIQAERARAIKELERSEKPNLSLSGKISRWTSSLFKR